MTTLIADGTIDDSALIHGGEYDPAKAHAYYLKTRKLKGRVRRSTGSMTSDKGLGRMKDFDSKQGQKYFDRSQKLEGRLERSTAQTQAEERLQALRARLDKLREELQKLVEQAKARSGVKPPSTDDKDPASKTQTSTSTEKTSTKESESKSDSKPLSAADKAKKAKADHDRYIKETAENRTVAQQIERVQGKIESAERSIRAALERAREQAKSTQTAPKGR